MPDYTVKADVDTMLRAVDNAAIRSAIGVGTTDAPTFLAQTLTGQSLTGTQATSLVDLSTTWLSTTGTPTAIKLNVTDTASNAASKLMDLQVGGVSQFAVKKNVVVGGGYAAAGFWGVQTPWVSFGNYYGSGAICGSTNGLTIFATPAASSYVNIGTQNFLIANTNNALAFGSGGDTILAPDAPGILAQRNGTVKQTLRIYNTYTSATVYERAVMDWNGPTPGNLQIGTEFLGSGSGMAARPIDFVTGGVVRMSIAAAGLVTIGGVPVGLGKTGGADNIAIGLNALMPAGGITGQGNLAIGYSALNNSGTYSFNVAVGGYALTANASGSNNTAIGIQALWQKLSGSRDVSVGSFAGTFFSGGAGNNNTSSSNSVFIGADTKPLADNQTNQIVIGFDATGRGSNSTTLNNTSATLTKINGTSAHVLDVTGTIKLSPPASVTPANNGELMVEATSNTTLTFKFKGSDGTVRSGTVILA